MTDPFARDLIQRLVDEVRRLNRAIADEMGAPPIYPPVLSDADAYLAAQPEP